MSMAQYIHPKLLSPTLIIIESDTDKVIIPLNDETLKKYEKLALKLMEESEQNKPA